MYEVLTILAIFTLLYSVVAGGVERTWISGPIIFMAFGILMGPVGFGLIATETDAELLMTLAELTLALVLFTDAANANLKVLGKVKVLPVRLLAIGLPLTILLGFGVGKVMFSALTIFEIALLATMLAPTDAALGKAVVTNEAVPDSVRQGLNVESGLNDGICVPILLLFLMLATGQSSDQSAVGSALTLFSKVVGIGLGAGVLLSLAAVFMLRASKSQRWLSPTWRNITIIALAFSCFGLAQALGGSGFIASFVGGMLFGGLFHSEHEELLGPGEGVGDTFALLTWVLFGAAVVGQAVQNFHWSYLVYAILSLTLIRMLPVYLCVAGLKMHRESKLFAGWFGPRGLASIVFIVIVVGEDLPHEKELAMIVVCTVFLSIVLHGVTANPWAKAYGARMRALGVT